MSTISTTISGSPTGGLYNIITVPSNAHPKDLSTINSSLCAVIDTSSSKGNLRIYRPTSGLNPFTTLEPEKAYVLFAHENFVLTLSAEESGGSNTSIWDSDEPTELFLDSSSGGSITVLSENSYYFTIDDSLSAFTMLVDGISGITFTNYFDINDYYNCKLGIAIADPALIQCNQTEVYTTQSVEFSTVNNDVFTFYYYTTGSVIAGMSKKGRPLAYAKPNHSCRSSRVDSSKAFWNSSVTNHDQPCTFLREDLQGTSTLKGRLKTGWVCRDVNPPLSIEAVQSGRWYYWSYGILNGAPEDRVYSVQRYFDRFNSLACPYKNPGYRKGLHLAWKTTTQEQNLWNNSLITAPVLIVNNINSCSDFVMLSSTDPYGGNDGVVSTPYAKDSSPFQGFIGSYGIETGKIDFPLYCVFEQGLGYRWLANTRGGGPSPSYATMTSQYFPNVVCPTSVEYGGVCVYTSTDPYNTITKMTVRDGKGDGWRDADSFSKLETDIGTSIEGGYKYDFCIADAWHSQKIRLAYCVKTGPLSAVANSPDFYTNYDSDGPYEIRAFEGDLTNNQPDNTWRRLGDTIIAPPTEGENVYISMSSSSDIAVATRSAIRVYELDVNNEWKLKGVPFGEQPGRTIMSIIYTGSRVYVSAHSGSSSMAIIYKVYDWDSVLESWQQLGQTLEYGVGDAVSNLLSIEPNGLNTHTYRKHMCILHNTIPIWVTFIDQPNYYAAHEYNPTTQEWEINGSAFRSEGGKPHLAGGYGDTVVVPALTGVKCFEYNFSTKTWSEKGGATCSIDPSAEVLDASLSERSLFVAYRMPSTTSMYSQILIETYTYSPTTNNWLPEDYVIDRAASNYNSTNTSGYKIYTTAANKKFVASQNIKNPYLNIVQSGIQYFNKN